MPSAVETIIGREVDGQFVVEESDVDVDATVAPLLRNDPERVGWLIVNVGSTILRVSWGRPGTGVSQIPIGAAGGSLSVNVREDFVLPTHELLAQVAAGTTLVKVIAIRRVNA